MSELLHLNDIIDYQRDIAPFRFVEIHAGPGAGKNTFIESLAKGDFPNAPKMRVLLITSRRAKVDETFAAYENPDSTDLELFQKRVGIAWDMINERGDHILATVGNTVCTSAFIAGYMKNVFKENERRTHLWDMYDLIAIDEAHSVMLDASYQDAPFHIYDLINHYLNRCISDEYPAPICKHILLLTGTPDPLSEYFPVNEVPANVINKMDECVNIQPQNVHFIESQSVDRFLNSVVQEKKRCIYFANRISRIKEIIENGQLPKDKIVVSFSDEDKRTELFETDRPSWDNMIATEKSIKENYSIPEQFSLFLTTSRYREGINIHDTIDVLVVESHNKSDVLQMAGRVRSGVKDLYIVVDVSPYPTDYTKEAMEQKLARIQLFGSTNPTDPQIKDSDGKIDKRCYPLNYSLNEIEPNQLQNFIDLVESKFPYVKYSYINSSFMMYVPRITGIKYIQKENKIWETAVENQRIATLVKSWFPDAIVEEYQSEYERKCVASWNIWNKYGFELNLVYSREVVDNFKAELSLVWEYKQINKLLSMFSDYECVRAGKNKKSMKFREIQ